MEGFPVVILNHNEPAFCCVPARDKQLIVLVVAVGKRERNEVYRVAEKR